MDTTAWASVVTSRRQIAPMALAAVAAFASNREAVSAEDVLAPRQCLAPSEAGGCRLSVQTPPSWQQVTPRTPMRLAQWALDPGGSAASVVIFYLPVGTGVDAQLSRWEAEFPPASRVAPPKRSGGFDAKRGNAALLEIAGSWNGGTLGSDNSGGKLIDGYALRGAIVPAATTAGDGREFAFFVKAIGPQSVIDKNKLSFDAFVASMKTQSSP